MAFNMELGEDEVHVDGRSEEKARELLKAADDAGVDPRLVRTTRFGYIVPKSILEETSEVDESEVSEEAPVAEAAEEIIVDEDSEEDAEKFDPSEHGLQEVKAYLKDADEEERQRVLDAEKEGKARKTLLSDDEGNN